MIQIGIIIAYFIVTIIIGIAVKGKTKTSSGFEGYKLGLLMCVAIGAGEWMGGTSTTGVSEYGYLYGLSGSWYTIANGIGICFLAVFFAKMFRRLNTSTVPEIIGRYIGARSRWVASIFLTFVLMIVGISQMISIGTLGESLLGLNPILSVCLLGGGVLIYTCLGGMNAIGYTNTVHIIVMYAGMLIALVICAANIGGLGTLQNDLPAPYFSMTGIGHEKVFSWIVASVLGACTAQAGLQPILKSKDEKTAVRSSFIIALVVAPFGILTALLGMIAKTQFPDLANAKLALPSLLMTLNPWISGLVLASLLAAVLSTASPIFLSCGTLITRDLYMEFHSDIKKDADRKLLLVSRLATFFAGAVCIISAVALSKSTSILDIVYFAYSLRGSLFIILLLGIFWKNMTQTGAITAMAVTALTGAFWVSYKKIVGTYPIPAITETYIAVITSFVVSVAVSLFVKLKSNSTVHNIRESVGGRTMRKSIVEYVSDHAMLDPNKTAVVVGEKKTSYAELYGLVLGYNFYLRKAGLKKGDIVVVRASQDLDYVVIYLGVHLAGGVVTSLERNISDEGMLKIAEQLGAKVIISDNFAFKDKYDAIYIERSGIQDTAKDHKNDDAEIVFPKLEDSADILFTTGTTGASKGVELSHKALTATAENLIYGCGYKKDTFLIAPGPLNHANAIRKLFTTLVNGSTICILSGMTNVKAFFTALDGAEGSIACCLPPAAIRTIFQLTRDRIGMYADRIDFIESATSPLPEPDKLKLCELLPNTRLYNNYGSSEAASVCMYDYNKYPGKDGCIGKPMPNSRIIIVDDDHKTMQSSKSHMGLIACIGDVNMKGYVNEPLLTKEVLKDGIIYTSDIGYIDDEGFVYIAGRKGDVINVGGLKVAPTEVESAALGFDGIEDCICIPVDDRITGKALKLLVVLKDGLEPDRKAISEYLAGKLEAYKVPRFYEKVDKVERTYNGKLNRKAYK